MKQQRRSSPGFFYGVLALIAIVGAVLIWRTAKTPRKVNAIDVQATPAQAEGYLLGNPNAPVQIMEFADFECPACANFATITEPDVRQRIVNQGLASYRYFDFPLPQHKNSIAASNAAACAADQGKFWEMHDLLFRNQPDWNGESTNNPKKYFEQYAKQLGLDMGKWNQCFDSQAHMSRIMGNKAEGERRQIAQTPTFFIGNKMIPGALTYDQFKAYVDTAAQQFAATATARADSQQKKGAPR